MYNLKITLKFKQTNEKRNYKKKSIRNRKYYFSKSLVEGRIQNCLLGSRKINIKFHILKYMRSG